MVKPIKESKKESKNERARELVGLREEYLPKNCMPFDFPVELGYHCPVCKYRMLFKGNYDERLEWSEYQGFIWCSVCNKDYPSVLCMPKSRIDEATHIYLDCIEEAILRNKKLKNRKK